MTWLYVIGGIAALILIIAFLPIRVVVQYDKLGLYSDARLFMLKTQLYPPDQREERRIRRRLRNERLLDMGTTILIEGGPVKEIWDLLKFLGQTIARLSHKLIIRKLKVIYVTNGDPASAALGYAQANIGLGAVLPMIDFYFKVKKYDIQTRIDCDAEEPTIYIRADMTIFLCGLVYILYGVLGYAVRLSTDYAHMKGGINNGKASN